LQINRVLVDLGEGHNGGGGVTVHVCSGGTDVKEEIRALKAEVFHIVVGTIGRVYDMMGRKCLSLDNLRMVVFDKVDSFLPLWKNKNGTWKMDKMLDSLLGTIKKMRDEEGRFDGKIAVKLFTATMESHFIEMTREMLIDPAVVVQVDGDGDCVDTGAKKQFYVNGHTDEWKLNTLSDLYDKQFMNQQIVIFCNTDEKVMWLEEKIRTRGCRPASSLSCVVRFY
jgi:superfamily II DNA/RNA helicase